MCGIVGEINCAGQKVDPAVLEAMRDRLSHRGPDDAGLFLTPDGAVGLGHRRLAVIDLSAAGHQPMTNETGTVWISFNGEIFNFPELKAALSHQGHVFRSHCDTEVIIHLYEEYGVDCLRWLNGQFAFVIWDHERQLVFAARDRLGIRPCYYFWDGGRFVFASELKALLPAVGKGELDYGALTDFLVLQYIPAPRTIYRHIRKLEAGACLTVRDGELKVWRYWEPQPEGHAGLSEEAMVARLDELLGQAVKRQLLADVPLGVFLSGGVDSSAITHYMADITQAPVQAFSVGFEEQDYSELPYAALAARHIPGVEHHQLILSPSEGVNLIQDLIRTLDEPFADQAIIPTYLMSRYARETVTVCLSGEGGDELFGGYDRYAPAIRQVKLWGDLSRFCPDLAPLVQQSLRLSFEDYLANLCSFHLGDLPRLLQRQARSLEDSVRGRFKPFYEQMAAADDLARVQRFDVSTYLADNLLFKVDRASMLASLEVRVPFLDHGLVDFCLGLPFQYRYRSHLQKYLLKKLMRGRLPGAILYRPKMGFSVPLFAWFQGSFQDYLRDTLLSAKARSRGLFRPAYVEDLLSPEKLATDKHNSLKLWCLLVLEEWFKNYHD
jgi:asparagine synthase (glutamine-hydrolysing)